MYACIPKIGGAFFEGVCTPSNATAHSYDPPPPSTQEKRSPVARAPARSGSRASLTWAAIQLGVEVNHHPPTARAPLASHPRTTLHVVDAPLEASHAGALLIGGTRPLGGHDDHAKSSSMSWSKRSSTLGADTATPRGPLPIADPALPEGCYARGGPVGGMASVEGVSEL